MIIVFKKGEQFPGALITALKKRKIFSVSFFGLGGFLKAELAFYDLKKKNYIKKIFHNGPYEVLALTGNVVLGPKGDLMSHCHAVLGKKDFSVFGGHLLGAVVGGTLELHVNASDTPLKRCLDKETGLQLLSPNV